MMVAQSYTIEPHSMDALKEKQQQQQQQQHSIEEENSQPHSPNEEEYLDLKLEKNQYLADIVEIRNNPRFFADDNIQRFLTRYRGDDVIDGWKLGVSKNDCHVVYGSVENNKWNTIKATTLVYSQMDEIFNQLFEAKCVPEYDEMTEKVEILENLEEGTQIRLVSAKRVMFTSPRDFCVASSVKKMNDGRTIIATRSTSHPLGKERRHFVRAVSMISGYIITPRSDNDTCCEVSVIAHMDLGGRLPAAVINFLGLSAPIKLLTKLRDIVEAAA